VKKISFFFIFILSPNLFYGSNINDYFPYPVESSSSNYGLTGVLELPNARFMKEASVSWNFSGSFPYEYTSITASPFSWMEASYRYTEIKNEKYGPSAYSGNQSLKDKGFDLKIRLIQEKERLPAIAIGLIDIAGTGLFSSEYLVATKNIYNFDVTFGLGWGVLGTQGGVSSPLKFIDKGFETRNSDYGQGGEFSFKDWFSGQASLLGAIEYDLKKLGLRLKVEYDTTNLDKRNVVEEVKSRFNFGATYNFSKNLKFSGSFERGNRFRFGFNLKGNFLEDTINKPSPKNVVKLNQSQQDNIRSNSQVFYRSLNRSLQEEQIYIQGASIKEDSVDLAVASRRFYSFTRTIGRSARIASALAPDEIKEINIHAMNGDFEIATIKLNRDELDSLNLYESSPAELLEKTKLISTSHRPLFLEADFRPKINFPEFDWSMSPALRHQIGGPEGFYLGQLFWKTDLNLKLRRNLALYTSFGINIYDTFNDFNNPSQSILPKVRSDIQEYLEQGKNNLQRLELQYFNSPLKDLFLRLDLGIMEEMFAGYGGEILYRPFDKSYSLGFSLHTVRQRDFDQRLSLRDYETKTGFLSYYLSLPYEINSKISAGKYLAGDKGLTLDLSRRFQSGFTLGVFATKTNLSAEEFGEGSFNKGFYISIPTQMFYNNFTSGNISFGLQPLTKDGGAMLIQQNALFGILGDSNRNSLLRDWDFLTR